MRSISSITPSTRKSLFQLVAVTSYNYLSRLLDEDDKSVVSSSAVASSSGIAPTMAGVKSSTIAGVGNFTTTAAASTITINETQPSQTTNESESNRLSSRDMIVGAAVGFGGGLMALSILLLFRRRRQRLRAHNRHPIPEDANHVRENVHPFHGFPVLVPASPRPLPETRTLQFGPPLLPSNKQRRFETEQMQASQGSPSLGSTSSSSQRSDDNESWRRLLREYSLPDASVGDTVDRTSVVFPRA